MSLLVIPFLETFRTRGIRQPRNKILFPGWWRPRGRNIPKNWLTNKGSIMFSKSYLYFFCVSGNWWKNSSSSQCTTITTSHIQQDHQWWHTVTMTTEMTLTCQIKWLMTCVWICQWQWWRVNHLSTHITSVHHKLTTHIDYIIPSHQFETKKKCAKRNKFLYVAQYGKRTHTKYGHNEGPYQSSHSDRDRCAKCIFWSGTSKFEYSIRALFVLHIICIYCSACWVKTSADDILNFFFFKFFPENRLWPFMQIISSGDNLHEMSMPIFWER